MQKGKSENNSPGSNGPRAQGVGAENHQHGLGHTLPLASSQPRNHRGGVQSSNTQTYDRSHVTGASSSTASSHGIRPNPPPSPSYTMHTERPSHYYPGDPNVQGMPPIHHHHHPSTHSLARRSHRTHQSSHYRDHPHRRKNDPPPTPATTDVNDESESGYPYFGNDLPRHHPGGGYDSEYYGVSQPPARAHPPTPRSQFDNSDVGTDHEYDHYHRYTEGSPFIPPPPTRSGSPTQEDD